MNTKLIIKEDQPAYRLDQSGARALAIAELLALVCGFSISKATELLAQVGGLHQLVGLSVHELQRLKGIGPITAAKILAAAELGRRVMAKDGKPHITGAIDAKEFLASHFAQMTQEHLVVASLDTKNRVIKTDTIYIGNVNSSIVRPAEVFAPAIRYNAPAIILAHNHPSGDPTPSPEDVSVTRVLIEAGKLLGIDVLDHIVVGVEKCVSLHETIGIWD